jgi:hypothetical protein
VTLPFGDAAKGCVACMRTCVCVCVRDAKWQSDWRTVKIATGKYLSFSLARPRLSLSLSFRFSFLSWNDVVSFYIKSRSTRMHSLTVHLIMQNVEQRVHIAM